MYIVRYNPIFKFITWFKLYHKLNEIIKLFQEIAVDCRNMKYNFSSFTKK
jgi:hypothetical protein